MTTNSSREHPRKMEPRRFVIQCEISYRVAFYVVIVNNLSMLLSAIFFFIAKRSVVDFRCNNNTQCL